MRDTDDEMRDTDRLRPVFIVGPARSGTPLLYRLLMGHPAFLPPAFSDARAVGLSETKAVPNRHHGVQPPSRRPTTSC